MVSYDDQAGTITLAVEVYDPAHWGSYHPEAGFSVGPTCGEPQLEGSVFQERGLGGTVGLNGYQGHVASMGSFNGQMFSITFQDPNFVGHEWHCLSMTGTQGTESFALGDWPTLNPTSDREAVLARIRHSVPAVERNYVCPEVEIFQGHSGCFAEYFAGGLWHLVEAEVTVTGDNYVVTIYFNRSWRRHWVTNSRSCARSWRLSGHLETNYGVCAASLAKDIPYELQHHHIPRYVGWDGTDTAGFDPMGLFPCHRHGSVITCMNALGDGIRYRP